MNKYYYSAESAHGNANSRGFGNDTIVYVWESKKTRDAYVKNSNNMSCEKITRKTVTSYASNYCMRTNTYIKPRPFSDEAWCIDMGIIKHYPGLVGEITIRYTDDIDRPNSELVRFYKRGK